MENQETIDRLREGGWLIAAELLELTQSVVLTGERLIDMFVRSVLARNGNSTDREDVAFTTLANLIELVGVKACVLKAQAEGYDGRHLDFVVIGQYLCEAGYRTLKADAESQLCEQVVWPARVQKLVMGRLLYHLRAADQAEEFLRQWMAMCYLLHLGLLGRSGLSKEDEKSVQEIASGEHGTAITFGHVQLPRLGEVTLGYPFLKTDSLGKWRPSGEGRDALVRIIIAAMAYKVRLRKRETEFFEAMGALYSQCPDLTANR